MNIYNVNTVGGLNPYNPGTEFTTQCWYSMASPRVELSMAQIGKAQNAFRGWFFQQMTETVPVNNTAGPPVRDWSVFDHTLSLAQTLNLKVIVTLSNEYGDCDVPASAPKTLNWYTTGVASRHVV